MFGLDPLQAIGLLLLPELITMIFYFLFLLLLLFLLLFLLDGADPLKLLLQPQHFLLLHPALALPLRFPLAELLYISKMSQFLGHDIDVGGEKFEIDGGGIRLLFSGGVDFFENLLGERQLQKLLVITVWFINISVPLPLAH